ncbi:bromodomain-containing protein 4 isoform X2 [Microcaecilia unicolor]|uniref:Bromodomain-containing protein 4-like isoform X2 n=1 Tax=Microcaecilia unicolor TaxID=1415580 RepID=A0A6P7WWV2_9AMPH|nr:bromodomain-containing protein 4-like isoform X2 [Microcaecilia unicolor]
MERQAPFASSVIGGARQQQQPQHLYPQRQHLHPQQQQQPAQHLYLEQQQPHLHPPQQQNPQHLHPQQQNPQHLHPQQQQPAKHLYLEQQQPQHLHPQQQQQPQHLHPQQQHQPAEYLYSRQQQPPQCLHAERQQTPPQHVHPEQQQRPPQYLYPQQQQPRQYLHSQEHQQRPQNLQQERPQHVHSQQQRPPQHLYPQQQQQPHQYLHSQEHQQRPQNLQQREQSQHLHSQQQRPLCPPQQQPRQYLHSQEHQQQQQPQHQHPQKQAHLQHHTTQLQFPPPKQHPLQQRTHPEQQYSGHHGQSPLLTGTHSPDFLSPNENQALFPAPGGSSLRGQQGQPPPPRLEAFSAVHIPRATEISSEFKGLNCSGSSLCSNAEVQRSDSLSPLLPPSPVMSDLKQQAFQRSLQSDHLFPHPDKPPVQTNLPFPQPERPPVQTNHPFPRPDRAPVQTNHPFPQPDRPPVQTNHPFPQPDRIPLQTNHPFVQSDRPPVQTNHPFPQPDRPQVQTELRFPQPDRLPVQTNHPFPQPDRPQIQTDHPFPHTDRPPVQSSYPFSHPNRSQMHWEENPELLTGQKAWINEDRLMFPSEEGGDQSHLQDEQDKQWLSSFLINRRKKVHPIVKTVGSPSVSEVRKLVYGALRLVSELTVACEELKEMTENGTAWSETYLKATNIYKDVDEKMKILNEPGYIEGVKKKLEKIKKKRLRLQRRKQETPEGKEDATRSAEREAKIDKWRMKCIQEVEEKNRERELKAAADSVLSEVRKKQADTKRMVDVLRALEKLRKLRKEAAGRKGISPPPSADETFEQHVARLRVLIRKRTELYDAEERALRVMLEGEQEEERKREQEKKQKKEREKLLQQQREINSILFGNPGMTGISTWFPRIILREASYPRAGSFQVSLAVTHGLALLYKWTGKEIPKFCVIYSWNLQPLIGLFCSYMSELSRDRAYSYLKSDCVCTVSD